MTNRSLQTQSSPFINRNIATSPPTSQNKTLIVGDSSLNGINYRGLRKDVKICARSGASIDDLWEEISVYDMKSFTRIIICIGGNDCSRKRNTSDFEDKYDQLIGFIKSVNQVCAVHLSKIVPRGDVDVSAYNTSFGGFQTIVKCIMFTALTNLTKCSLGGVGYPWADIILKTGFIYHTQGQNDCLMRGISMSQLSKTMISAYIKHQDFHGGPIDPEQTLSIAIKDKLTIVPEIIDTMDPGEMIIVVVTVVTCKDTF